MKTFFVIILFVVQLSPVFGQVRPDEPFGRGLYTSSFYTSAGNIAELKNDVIQACLANRLVDNSLRKKNHSTGHAIGKGLIIGGACITLGMGLVYQLSSEGGEPGSGTSVLLVSNEQAKIYGIITISGLGALGAGLCIFFINKKYEHGHHQRFTVISTRDHAGIAYNF